jgi:HEAT repeat protein
MTSDEFSKFIDVMSEPTMADMKGQASKDKFVESLKANAVFNLSFVFRDDFVTARPGVPWRVNLALSRLRKDLRTAPILQNLKKEDLGRVRKEIMTDILRPLGETDHIYAFVMNLDLAVAADLTEEEGETDVLSALREDRLIDFAQMFVKDASQEDKRFFGAVAPEKFPRVAARLTGSLTMSSSPEAKGILETMFSSGLVSMDALPADVRERVSVIKKINAFLDDREGQLKKLDAATDVWDYSERAETLVKIAPGLIARGKYDEAASIIERFVAHGKEKSERAVVAQSNNVAFGVGAPLEEASRAFLIASKEERTVIGRLFMAMGDGAVPSLLDILEATDDVWRSKQAAEILVHIGRDAATSLIHEVEQSAMKPAAMSAIIRVLGEITDQEVGAAAVKAIVPKADDAHPDVRREVLLTLSRLQPSAHFDKFAAKIGDPDVKVRKAALHGLGRSGDPRALEKLKVIVAHAEQAGQEAAWDLAGAAIENIGALYQSCPKARADIAKALPEVADKVVPKRSLKGLFKAAVPVPVDVALALATAAGRIEGPEAQVVLDRLSGHWSKTVTAAVADLLKTRSAAKK